MQKIIVTGGAGYIGSHTVVELLSAGFEPIIIDNFSNSEPWIIDRITNITGVTPKVYVGDCTDSEFVESVFTAEPDISAVIHFAAFKSVGESVQNPLKYYKNNIGSTVTILEAMQAHAIPAFVFSSSATVYGEPEINPIPETEPRRTPFSPYAATKIMCEDIVEDTTKSSALKAISLRYFNPVGAHPSGKIGELPKGVPNNLFPYLTQVAAGLREQLVIFGTDYNTIDGSCVRDYIHVVDLARAHVAALRHLALDTTPAYDIFNVGTGKGTSVLELVHTFETVNELQIPHTIGDRRPGDIAEYYGNPKKIAEVMGWKSEFTIEDCVKDSWHWQQSLGQ